MDNDILISVIMPVYNAASFLNKAVDSILCQMDGTIELILVDDGSKDESGSICDAYAAQNPQIRVFHKENGGTSSAKNVGIDAAVGEYITFIDSDDYIDSTTYSDIQKIIAQHKPDCIDFGWRYISNGEPLPPAFHKLPKNVLLDRKFLLDTVFPPLLNLRKDPDMFVFDFCCNKVFRTQIIRENNVHFDEDKPVWEDRTFLLRHLKYCDNYFSIDKCYYNYVNVPGSLSRRYSMDFFRIILANFKHYSELFSHEYDFDTQYVNNYWCRAVENMIYRSLDETKNKEAIRNNILQALADAQVVHWYTKRQPENQFEEEVSRLISSAEYEKALLKYEKYHIKRAKKQAKTLLVGKAKQVVRKLLGR